MSANTATDTLTLKLEDVKFSYGPDRLEGIGVRDNWYDPREWDVEVRLIPRLPDMPGGALALVDGAVWRKSAELNRWSMVGAFGFLGPFKTDRQVWESGKPLNVGEWPSV